MAQGTEEIQKSLETSLTEDAGKSESATDKETAPTGGDKVAAADEKVTKESKGSKSTMIPKDRFDEVIGQRNKYAEDVEALQSEMRDAHESLRRTTEMLASRDQDSQIVNELRRLAADPKYKPMVETLDRAIQGIEEEVEDQKGKPSADQNRTLELLKQTREEVGNELADQRAELLLSRADSIAERYLAALPEEYTDSDKKIIAHMWTDKVDWEAIEESPNVLTNALVHSLEEVLDIYGEPKGVYAKHTTTEDPEDKAKPEPTVDEQLQALLSADKNYGAMKDVKLPDGKVVKVSEMSDDDFNAQLATAMRLANKK